MEHAAGSTSATRMAPERERALVSAARSDPRAFAELYDYYLPRIYGFIYRRVQERSVAEDITATTFHRALEAVRRETFRNDAFGGWLYRVAANSVVDHVRASGRVVPLDPAADPADPPLEAFASSLDRDELRGAMRALPETHRRVLLLRFFDDLDPDEASSVLGCSRRTFAVKLHRAIAALREAMTAPVPAAAGPSVPAVAGVPAEAHDAA